MSENEHSQFLISRKPLPKEPPVTEAELIDAPQERSPALLRYYQLLGLIITTALSSALLASNAHGWTLSDSHYRLVSAERASIQIVVQILSTAFGALQVTAICALINLATRLRLSRSKASLDGLRFWFNLCIHHMEWTLPFHLFAPLLCFVALTFIPSALWAGAISPVDVVTTQQGAILIPQYRNVSFVKEYPSEYNSSVPQERNMKGAFAYNVGINLEGSLLDSASTATTIDGSPRQHRKLDNSGFTYIGRSYGVGSSAGLTDDSVSGNSLAIAYSYQETGYDVAVDCVYNSSTGFVLEPDGDGWLWAAEGDLPNSNGDPEFSVYTGRSTSSIVSLGVAHNQTNGTQFLGITTGRNYASLNMTQCSMAYIPTNFNVSVSTRTRNITVTPLSKVSEIDLTGHLSHVASRQLELISNDQTNLYQSLLGNSLLASIADYNISMSNESHSLSEATSTLAGLENSITAMLDDILVGYASAQLVVGKDYTNTSITIEQEAIRLGEGVYIYAVAALNVLALLLVIGEAVRTRLWNDLIEFDYLDLRDLVIGTSQGGRGIARTANTIRSSQKKSASLLGRNMGDSNAKVGKILVRLDKTTSGLMSAA